MLIDRTPKCNICGRGMLALMYPLTVDHAPDGLTPRGACLVCPVCDGPIPRKKEKS